MANAGRQPGTRRRSGVTRTRRVDIMAAMVTRRDLLLDQAANQGLISNGKNARISGRVSSGLIKAAMKSARITSDSDLIEYALLTVALQDDFGARLVRRKGAIPADIDLER